MRRLWDGAGFKITHFLLEPDQLLLLLKEHGHEHHVERRFAGEVGPGGRMFPRCGEEQVQGLLVFRPERAAVAAPRFNFTPHQLRKRRKCPSHIQDVEKGRQLRSRIARNLNVPRNVRLGPSLAAALLNGLFDHPAEPGCASRNPFVLQEPVKTSWGISH